MKRFFGLIIIGLVLSGLVWTGCQKKAEEKVVKIGAIFALTGDAAMYGERAKRGVELALEEINKEGIREREVNIIYEDSQGDPQKAVSAFQKLVELDKVKFIIGPLSSSEVLSIAPMAEKKKVIILTPTSSAPQITDAGDYIFRNCMSDLFDGAALAEFVVEELQKKTAGIIYINNDFGIGLKESFKKRFSSLTGEIIIEESFERRDTDFRTQLSRIKAKNPDVLFLVGYAEMGQILKQAKELGLKSQIVSFSSFEQPDIIKVAGNAAEGVYYTFQGFDAKSEEEVVKNFTAKYKGRYNEDSDIFAALSYDALKIYAEVLKEGGFNVEDVKRALYGIKDFVGVTEKTSFDKNGDVIKPIGIKVVKDGKFVWVLKAFEMRGEK
jgi:branched-chain amino acid transport system substrate-binding protein